MRGEAPRQLLRLRSNLFRPQTPALMIRSALSSIARLKCRSPTSSESLAVNVQHSVTSKSALPTSSSTVARVPASLLSPHSPAHGTSSGFRTWQHWASPSERLGQFHASQKANFHFSARHLNRRHTYVRFGGRSSSGGIFENLAARFSDPGTRAMILLVVGLGGKLVPFFKYASGGRATLKWLIDPHCKQEDIMYTI